MDTTPSYKRVRRDALERPTVVRLPAGASAGARALFIAAGPCSVETPEQIDAVAAAVAAAGANVLRGGAYKPRTSPYAFPGLGPSGLVMLSEAAARHGLDIVTEVLDPRDVAAVAGVAGMLQIGTRNMHNFALLREAGASGKPVLLKRGFAATIDEWLHAAEYVLTSGSDQVVLCERGIRSFDPRTRNVLDLAAVPLVKGLSHLPVVVDPSHATGTSALVTPMALAAVASGADGLLIEVHPNPQAAFSDGAQSLTPAEFGGLMRSLEPVAAAVGRSMPSNVIAA